MKFEDINSDFEKYSREYLIEILKYNPRVFNWEKYTTNYGHIRSDLNYILKSDDIQLELF